MLFRHEIVIERLYNDAMDAHSSLFQELSKRVGAGTLVITAGGGVIRGMTTALAKQIVNQHGIHIAFSEPTADEELNPQVKTGGNRLEGLYQLMLSAVETKEAEAQKSGVDLQKNPIHLFLKLQPYHLTAEERGEFFTLSGKHNVFSFRDPIRTMESIIVGMLKITRDQRPDLDIKEIIEPGADISFIDAASPEKPMAQLVDHLLKTRDYSILGEGFLKYFSYYPVLNDPVLKLDVWKHYQDAFPQQAAQEAKSLGFESFDQLMHAYSDTRADQFSTLPPVLFEPLKFRRTGYASMKELAPIITSPDFASGHSYAVVESTLLQLRPERFLHELSKRLDLPKREDSPSLSYSQFDPGFKGNVAIHDALFGRVDALDTIQLPEAKPPITPSKLPKSFQEELRREYEIYVRYLCDPHRIKSDTESLVELFNTRLSDGKPAAEHYSTTMYAIASVDMDEPQRSVIKHTLRANNPDYHAYFDLIDAALQKTQGPTVSQKSKIASR